jgi:branched-chain amino acid transport system permease protein
MMELGGIGTFMGPILGSAVIVFGNEFLRLAGTLRLAILGGLICVTILFFPGGIIQLIDWVGRKLTRKTQGV